ncbi:MAG: hypothetical protein QXE59_05310, partial [Saccharolobus sp.]
MDKQQEFNNKYYSTHSLFMRLGKIDEQIFTKIIYPNLGKRHEEVIIAPQHGVDTGVIDLQDGRVLVVKTDPVFIVPQFGFKK